MCFPEKIRFKVKKQADFTCCWCRDRLNKVEVHHIIPRSKNGLNTEENAAPLCGNCHTILGGNPELKKEIIQRRDYWYEICQKKNEFAWSPSLHIPMLDSYEYSIPDEEKTKHGTNVLEDWPRFKLLSSHDQSGFSPLQISIGYYPELHGGNKYPRLLTIKVEIPFGLLFNLSVCSDNYWDVSGLMDILRNRKDIWMVKSHPDDSNTTDPAYQLRDYLMLIRMENGENRLLMKTFFPTESGIAFQARLTDDVLIALSDYLESKGYNKRDEL